VKCAVIDGTGHVLKTFTVYPHAPRYDRAGAIAALEDAAARTGVTPGTVDYAAPKALIWIESPTNPMLEVGDVPAICAAAKQLGVVSAVDNTFSTPLVQRPLSFGADVVVHSATKFLAGHSAQFVSG